MDACSKNTTEYIWDYYGNQYKKKNFWLRFTLFFHLIISKRVKFQSIIVDNAEITLDKLTNWKGDFSRDFKLAIFLHKLKDIYLKFTKAY